MLGSTFAGGASTRYGRRLRLRVSGGVLGGLAALIAIALPASPALAKPSSYLAKDRSLVYDYVAIEGAKVGVVLPGGPERFIEVKESSKSLLPTPTGPALGLTDCRDASNGQVGPATKCVIEFAVLPHKNGELRETVAHEVFHVFQAIMSGTIENFIGEPRKDWLIEGSAMWVESDLVSKDRGARNEWKRYLRAPSTPLFSRSYSAIGFFGHMASTGLSPWPRFKAIFAATSSAAAYAAAVGGDPQFLDSEASVFFREPKFGALWDQEGPNVPTRTEVGFKPTAVSVTKASAAQTLIVKPYAEGPYELSIKGLPPEESVVELQVVSGYVRLHSIEGGRVTEIVNGQLLLCSDPMGCSCPSRPNHYEDFMRGDLAITGGPSGGEVRLTRRKPCEVLLAPVMCEQLLPGFSNEVSTGVGAILGQTLGAHVSTPEGTTVSNCGFLDKGHLDSEGNFVGVVAPFVQVLRASTIAGAIRYYKLISVPIPGYQLSPTPTIGEEAELLTKEGTGGTGEVEYGSIAAVRVHNIVLYYGLYGTPGNTEASPAASLALLRDLASAL